MDTVLNRNVTYDIPEVTQEVEGEKIKRTLVKTRSWQFLGTMATIVISYLITGTLALAFSIGFIALISKLLLLFSRTYLD